MDEDKRAARAAALRRLSDALSLRGSLAAERSALSARRWVRRRRLAAQIALAERSAVHWAPQALTAAHGAVAAADAARAWGRTELAHPRQHVREAAAALLEAIGEPVPVPAALALLSDLASVLSGAPGDVGAWDDLARRLKTRSPDRYPVLTGTQLRSQALAAGVRELSVPGPVRRRRGTSYEAVAAAQEAAR
jgi:hypothetical protein